MLGVAVHLYLAEGIHSFGSSLAFARQDLNPGLNEFSGVPTQPLLVGVRREVDEGASYVVEVVVADGVDVVQPL